MSKGRIMLLQPGACGDLIICAPIAKWYADAGYEIYWPVRDELYRNLECLDYVTPIALGHERDLTPENRMRFNVQDSIAMAPDYGCEYFLNLADRGPGPTNERPGEGFERAKYRVANVPFEERHNLVWTRNETKEDYIYNRFVNLPGYDRYAFVHSTSSHKEESTLPDLDIPIVTCDDFSPDYNIYDWYKVIVNADQVYVTESAIWCFCDGIVHELSEDRYIIPRSNMGGCTSVAQYWKKDFAGNTRFIGQ